MLRDVGRKFWNSPEWRIWGHELKPFVKRQKNDMADAKAICEAAQRPAMRFVAVKSEAKQAEIARLRGEELLR